MPIEESRYTRVVEPERGEGESFYRNHWRNTMRERVRSRYLDHLDAARAHDNPDHAVNELFARAIDFDAADDNFSGALSFGEFARLVRSMDTERTGEPRTKEQIRRWFSQLDLDGDGVVTKAEYFHFAIRESACGPDRGHGLRMAFARVDPAGTGKLNQHDFRRACQKLGFGEVASQLFQMLPADYSGRIDYRALVREIRRRYAKEDSGPSPGGQAGESFHEFAASAARRNDETNAPAVAMGKIQDSINNRRAHHIDEHEHATKAMAAAKQPRLAPQNTLATIRNDSASHMPAEPEGDGGDQVTAAGILGEAAAVAAASADRHTSPLDEGEGGEEEVVAAAPGSVPPVVKSLREELLGLMQRSGATVADIFRFIDKDSDHDIDKHELESVLVSIFGREVKPEQLTQVWDYLNPDFEGSITFGEFHRWLKFGSAEDDLENLVADDGAEAEHDEAEKYAVERRKRRNNLATLARAATSTISLALLSNSSPAKESAVTPSVEAVADANTSTIENLLAGDDEHPNVAAPADEPASTPSSPTRNESAVNTHLNRASSAALTHERKLRVLRSYDSRSLNPPPTTMEPIHVVRAAPPRRTASAALLRPQERNGEPRCNLHKQSTHTALDDEHRPLTAPEATAGASLGVLVPMRSTMRPAPRLVPRRVDSGPTRLVHPSVSDSQLLKATSQGRLGGHPGFIMPPRVRPPPSRFSPSASAPRLVPKPVAKLIDVLDELKHGGAPLPRGVTPGSKLSSAAATWARHRYTHPPGGKTPPVTGLTRPWAASRFGLSTAWQEGVQVNGLAANVLEATISQIKGA